MDKISKKKKKDSFWTVAFALCLIIYVYILITDGKGINRGDMMFCGLLALGIGVRIMHWVKMNKILTMTFDGENDSDEDDDIEDEDPYLTKDDTDDQE